MIRRLPQAMHLSRQLANGKIAANYQTSYTCDYAAADMDGVEIEYIYKVDI